jgi:predicted nucleotidyltransferase
MSSGAVELDVEAILRTLVAEGVEFLVIGGLAVAVHGYPRATKDVDIVPRPAAANLERLYGALAAISARPVELGELRPPEMPVDFGPSALALGGNWALQTEHGRVDVMQWLPGAAGYDELDANAVPIEVRGVGTVRFPGYEDLVGMKTAAGRRQDEEDLARLRQARAED